MTDLAPTMELREFLAHVNRGALIEGGSPHHRFMHDAAQDALRIIARLNTGYHPADEVRALLAELTGKDIDESVTLFPPFYSEFGKNLTVGRDVFINLGCRFQDTGGITIGDGGRDHRRRSDRRCRSGRHQGRAGPFHRRRRPCQGHPRDRIQQLLEPSGRSLTSVR
jgi:hypothetical protein